jgi:hypothetical protein
MDEGEKSLLCEERFDDIDFGEDQECHERWRSFINLNVAGHLPVFCPRTPTPRMHLGFSCTFYWCMTCRWHWVRWSSPNLVFRLQIWWWHLKFDFKESMTLEIGKWEPWCIRKKGLKSILICDHVSWKLILFLQIVGIERTHESKANWLRVLGRAEAPTHPHITTRVTSPAILGQNLTWCHSFMSSVLVTSLCCKQILQFSKLVKILVQLSFNLKNSWLS